MKKMHLVLLLAGLSTMPAAAQSITEIEALGPDERRAYLESMSAEERQAMREKWRDEYHALPEEERQAIRERMRAQRGDTEKREQRRQRWESMSDEERAALKQRREARIQERQQRWESMSDEEREAFRERFREQRRHDRGND